MRCLSATEKIIGDKQTVPKRKFARCPLSISTRGATIIDAISNHLTNLKELQLGPEAKNLMKAAIGLLGDYRHIIRSYEAVASCL